MDQHGVEFQPDMEECLFGDFQLCTSFSLSDVNLLIIFINSSARGLQDRLSKRGKLLWYGDSGQAWVGIVPIDNGHRDKLLKRKIISLIGMFSTFVSTCRCLYFSSVQL